MVRKYLVILFLASLEALGQKIIEVVSQEDGTPIPYVHISVAHARVGFTTDENGMVAIGDQFQHKTLVFYAVGYHQRSISVDSIVARIELKPKTSLLDEIEVFPKKSQEYVLDEIPSPWISTFKLLHINSGVSVIAAKTFHFPEEYNEILHVRSVALKTKSRIEGAKFQLHVYALNEIGLPEDDLITVPIIIELEKGTSVVEVDLTEYELVFPKNGLAIGVEWLLIASNRHVVKGEIHYEPSF